MCLQPELYPLALKKCVRRPSWVEIHPEICGFSTFGHTFFGRLVSCYYFKLEKKKVSFLLDENHLIHATSCHQQRNCPFNKTHSLATKMVEAGTLCVFFTQPKSFIQWKLKSPKCSLCFPQEDFSPWKGPARRPGLKGAICGCKPESNAAATLGASKLRQSSASRHFGAKKK